MTEFDLHQADLAASQILATPEYPDQSTTVALAYRYLRSLPFNRPLDWTQISEPGAAIRVRTGKMKASTINPDATPTEPPEADRGQ